MDSSAFDIVVIGAGIAGATAAAALAADRRVALVEAEEAAGYHTTGRSAAMWMQNYGPLESRTLSRLSQDFFRAPPEGFAEAPLWHARGALFIAPEDQVEAFETMLAEAKGMREIPVAEAARRVPALREGWAKRAAIEEDAFDMDVAVLHQGFLRQLTRQGGRLALRARSGRIERRGGTWHVQTTGGDFTAPVVVDAAGAWGDEVAAQAGVAPLGLAPKRRTGVIVDPAPWAVAGWPMVNDISHTWYARPEARTRLMVSPADETDMPAHDVQPDELDVAIAVDRMQQALDITVTRIERSWAGLRTFTPDRRFAFGWDDAVPGFFWCVGQGGFGIQTSPAAGRLVADLVSGRDPGPAAVLVSEIDPKRLR